MIDYWFKMEDLGDILEGKTSIDVGKHGPIKRGINFCFMWLSIPRICRERFSHMFIICDQDRGHREKSETIDQQGNISIFTFRCIKKDN